jgi:hypothetical protein
VLSLTIEHAVPPCALHNDLRLHAILDLPAFSVLQVILELTPVFDALDFPVEIAHAMLHALSVITDVLIARWVNVCAFAMLEPVFEFSLVGLPIGPFHVTFTAPEPSLILPFIVGVIFKLFISGAML